MPWKKRIVLFLIIVYLILLFPYLIVSNAGEAGIVIENRNIDSTLLHDDVQDLLRYKKDSYYLLLVEDQLKDINKPKGQVVKERKLIISDEKHIRGSFVSIDNIVADIHVTSYNIIPRYFEKLIIGNVKKPVYSDIIELINYYNMNPVIIISKIDFYAGGFLIVLLVTLFFCRKVALWNIPALITLYSFQSFLAIIIASQNDIEVDNLQMIFGFVFILSIPLSIWIHNYEKSEPGRQKIKELYLFNNKLLRDFRKKFGI